MQKNNNNSQKKPLLQGGVSGCVSLSDRLLEYFPKGYRIYRRNCFLIEHQELDIMVQVSKRPKNLLSCCLYGYIEKGKKFAVQPLFFRGDEEKVLKLIHSLKPALLSTNKDELHKSLLELSDVLKNDIMGIHFGS